MWRDKRAAAVTYLSTVLFAALFGIANCQSKSAAVSCKPPVLTKYIAAKSSYIARVVKISGYMY